MDPKSQKETTVVRTVPRYTYAKHGWDKYYGQRLFMADECCGKDQFRVSEHILVRDEEGRLGHIGSGVRWALNWITDTGACCFNPCDEKDLLWSPYHHAFVWSREKEHFAFPVIVGEFYCLVNGAKLLGVFKDEEVARLPKWF